MYYIYDLYFKDGFVLGSRVDNQFPPRIGETITLRNFKSPCDKESRTVTFRVEKVDHIFDFDEKYKIEFYVFNIEAREIEEEEKVIINIPLEVNIEGIQIIAENIVGKKPTKQEIIAKIKNYAIEIAASICEEFLDDNNTDLVIAETIYLKSD